MRLLLATFLIIATAALVVGCGKDAPRQHDSAKSATSVFEKYYGASPSEAATIESTFDTSIRPTSALPGWNETSPGQWGRAAADGSPQVVLINSYIPPFGDWFTPAQLIDATKQQLRAAAKGPVTFPEERSGSFLGLPAGAYVRFGSLSPEKQIPVDHAQYMFTIGPRVYNVIGVSSADTWATNKPDIERFIRSLDPTRPVDTKALTVLPGYAAPDEPFPTLTPGASAREVQDVLSTWTYDAPDSDKPWFPRKVECGDPSSKRAARWRCEVDFLAPSSFENDVEVTVRRTANGTWDAQPTA